MPWYLAALLPIAVINIPRLPCLLTVWEKDLWRLAGQTPYRGGFISHYFVKPFHAPGLDAERRNGPRRHRHGLVPRLAGLRRRHPPAPRRSGLQRSQGDTQSCRDALKVLLVAGDHDIASSGCANDHGSVDHITGAGPCARGTRRPSAGLIEDLDPAARQQSGHLRLRTAAPALSQHARRNGQCHAFLECALVQRPYLPVTAFRCNQRTRVICQSGHAGGSRTLDRVDHRVCPHQ